MGVGCEAASSDFWRLCRRMRPIVNGSVAGCGASIAKSATLPTLPKQLAKSL